MDMGDEDELCLHNYLIDYFLFNEMITYLRVRTFRAVHEDAVPIP